MVGGSGGPPVAGKIENTLGVCVIFQRPSPIK